MYLVSYDEFYKREFRNYKQETKVKNDVFKFDWGNDIILKNQRNQLMELFEHEDIRKMSNDLLDGYEIAKDEKDIKRIENYKKKIQDYFLLDKNLVHTEVITYEREQEIIELEDRILLRIDTYLHDEEDKKVYVRHHMPIENIRIREPICLKDYEGHIPIKIYKRIKRVKDV